MSDTQEKPQSPFDTLLVANRGEIAVRILRSARAMGLRTVAVYSDADRDALHVELADLAVRLGPSAPAESYLNIARVIAAARDSGAQAVHPGYGFLAENPAFAEACEAAGLVFVGPSAKSIQTMGDKAEAKAQMRAAGVPCVPGYDGIDQNPAVLLNEAEALGWPVMIKAVAGGGGRGMRLVRSSGEFNDALASARSEARNSFGYDRVLLEKAIEVPRHIEIQIMADRYGNVIHLGERDCSVQRRHQKVIEEAPSPAVTPDLRQEMGAAAIAAARAIGYEGAGTLEFLLGADGGWYFMEMNTRLQVEHPVTEAITGLDLVEMQLRIAAGGELGLTQQDVGFSGHAIEVRLCAEAPEAEFLPQAGKLERWRPAPGLRIDHGLRDGAVVPPDYDSMIAKLVAHGPDRETARRRLLLALEQTQAMGIETNQAFLGRCLAHPVFAAGGATTGFIEQHAADILPTEDAATRDAAGLVAGLLRAAPRTALTHGFSVPVRLGRGEARFEQRVTAGSHGQCQVTDATGEPLIEMRVRQDREEEFRYLKNGSEQRATLLRSGDRLLAHVEGRSWIFDDLSLAPVLSGGADIGDGTVRASMAGRIVAVGVRQGDRVEAGAVVAILEAMKMEHAHTAAVSGEVAQVHVGPGDQVAARGMLVEIITDDTAASKGV
ncbi:acetyl-CoA carboxylase biotin carboxylase subunit [Seohaeicola saemankumensis]|nr:acetyl-CoA carboxylase biotin carboxylase subunit [Seohaeicola saemankumensis]MCA0873294.1 acetyl-CoA carboxylase biotin carboxylase subunit [Seohaeicola saemankumensis]